MTTETRTFVTKNRETGILSLPLEIFHAILEVIYLDDFQSFLALRRISKVFRYQSEHFLFSSITLEDGPKTALSFAKVALKRLRDRNDSLSKNVRHLQLGPFQPNWFFEKKIFKDGGNMVGAGQLPGRYSDDCAIAKNNRNESRLSHPMSPVLHNVLCGMNNLESLTWVSHLPFPCDMLDRLHSKFPSVRLVVKNMKREGRCLDAKLLSSPQIHTVEITIYKAADFPESNELGFLKDYLSAGRSIKALQLDIQPIGSLETETCLASGPLNFNFIANDWFPPLEELKIQSTEYLLSLEHCQMWSQCMDWGELRKLDIGNTDFTHLIRVLTGQVPRLKSLTLGSHYWRRFFDQNYFEEDMLSLIEDFLCSIPALDAFTFKAFRKRDIMLVLPLIPRCLGSELKSLSLLHDDDAFETSEFSTKEYVSIDFLGDLPQLESMKMKSGALQVQCQWPRGTDAIEKYSSLRNFFDREWKSHRSRRAFFDTGLDLFR